MAAVPESLLARAQLLLRTVGGEEGRVDAALAQIAGAVVKLGGAAGEWHLQNFWLGVLLCDVGV